VLGVVPGIIGCLQALEAIKIATKSQHVFAGKMLLFDGKEATFRSVKLRGRSDTCSVCGANPSITSENYSNLDYPLFCSSQTSDLFQLQNWLDRQYQISCQEYQRMRQSGSSHILLDVREPIQFKICSLPNSLNIPLRLLSDRVEEIKSLLPEKTSESEKKRNCIDCSHLSERYRFTKSNTTLIVIGLERREKYYGWLLDLGERN